MKQDAPSPRFEVINPHRWFSHWVTIAAFIMVPAVWVPLVWTTSVKDHSPEAAREFWGSFVAFGVIWVFALVWSRRAYRSPDKNYVEILADELRIRWAGKLQTIGRSDVTGYKVAQRRWFPEAAWPAFSQWAPAAAHVELILRKPVWFKYLGTIGQWKAECIPMEARDINGFKGALDDWLDRNEAEP